MRKPKAGKSFMVLNIGLAVAMGGKALGFIDVEQGDVLYLALEDTKRRLKCRAKQLMSNGDPPDNFYGSVDGWGRLPQAGDKIKKFIEEHQKTRLVIVDTLQKIKTPSKKSGNIYGEMELDRRMG